MQSSDRAPEGVTTVTTVASSESMLEALKQLYRAYQRTSIYPRGHPAVPLAYDEAIRRLEEALASEDAVQVTAGRDHLSVNGSRLDDTSGALGSLALLLRDLDLAAIGFRAGIERAELETFVRALGEARRDGVKGAALAERLAEQVDRLEVTPIDYGALRFKEGQRERGGPEAEDLWDSVSEMLTGPSVGSADVANPEELAREIDQDIEEGAGIEVVRERISRLSQQINDARPDKRAAGRTWLTKFVSALNPRLRSDLLRIDPRLPDSSLELMNELTDVLPEKELFNALQKIDRAGGRLPSQFLTLMNKLMRLAGSRPSLRTGLEEALDGWNVPRRVLDEGAPSLCDALTEVLQRRGGAEFNPRPYQSLLDGLAVQTLSGTDTSSTAIYRDSRDSGDVRLHAAEVAVRLAAQPGGEQYRPGVFRRVAETTELLIAHNRLDQVRDAAVSARGYSLHKHAGEQTRQAAKSFLQQFKDEGCIQLILEQAMNEGSLSDAGKVLLDLGGVTALGLTLDLLNDKLPRTIETDLQCAAAERSPEELLKVLQWRAERGWEAVRPIFPVIRLLDPDIAAGLLEGLLVHEELEVRREALLTLIALVQPETLLRPLRRGLADGDPRFVTVVVRSLADLRCEQAVELLGAYIEGGLSSAPPTLECGSLAVRCLARMGEVGIERLCLCLDRLSGSYRPIKVRLAIRVRDALKPHAASADVSGPLRRWRFSPAGVIDWLKPGNRTPGAKDEG